MDLKGVSVEVVQTELLSCNTEAVVVLAQSLPDNKIKAGLDARLVKDTSLSARYVIAIEINDKSTDDAMRQAIKSALWLAQDQGAVSLGFSDLGCGSPDPICSKVSKIMAQEVFRFIHECKHPSIKRIVFAIPQESVYEVFHKNICQYLDYISHKMIEGPFVMVDGIVLYQQGIVLIQRSNPPLGWALPGGFVDYGESLEMAVKREVKEETNLDFVDCQLFDVSSDPNRDPRFHTISVVYVGKGRGTLAAGSDAQGVAVYPVDNLPDHIAFDHRDIIGKFKKSC